MFSLGIALGALLFSAWVQGWLIVLRRSGGMLGAGLPVLAAGASGILLFTILGMACLQICTPGHVSQVTFFSASCSAAAGLLGGILTRRRERARLFDALPAGRIAIEAMMLRNSAILAIVVAAAAVGTYLCAK